MEIVASIFIIWIYKAFLNFWSNFVILYPTDADNSIF
jgi:hypothetical protein